MIVKIGGSVADKLDVIVGAIRNAPVAVVPGGWRFADLVREVDSAIHLPSSVSHWMAVASMDVYGHYISSFGIDTFEPDSLEECRVRRAKVLLLHHLLMKLDREGGCDLPHSWEVTSDSIAVWIAAKLGLKVVKVTKPGGMIVGGKIVDEIDASELEKMGESVVDAFTPKLLRRYGLDMFICGAEEIKSYILRGRAKGTLIRGR